MSSIKKNFIYNLIYQILVLIIPLITAPYLARVVGAEGVGIYSFTYTSVYYFMLITLLGVNNYGNRKIAQIRDNKTEITNTFWEIYSMQFFMGIAMFLIYWIYIFINKTEFQNIAMIQSIFIISAILDINWLFFGLEEFKKTIIRNTVIKILSLILIFIFVKQPNDLWKYTTIMSITTVIGQLVLWKYLFRYVEFRAVKLSNIKKHIKQNLILFIPILAVSLYKMMDKIMLGYLVEIKEVGYYENAEKIINIPLTFISALGTVLLPRISNVVAKGKGKTADKYLEKSLIFILWISIAMMIGMIAIGKEFSVLFFGSEFVKTGDLINILAITIPIISFSYVLKMAYCIPYEKDSIYIKSVIYGAVINLILNFVCIPKLGSIGASIGTIAAEIIVMLYQTFCIFKVFNIKKVIKNGMIFVIKRYYNVFVYLRNKSNI